VNCHGQKCLEERFDLNANILGPTCEFMNDSLFGGFKGLIAVVYIDKFLYHGTDIYNSFI